LRGAVYEGEIRLITELATTVSDLRLHPGIKQALVSKLDSAVSSLKLAQPEPACDSLGAFTNQATAQRGKHLTIEQSDMLIASNNSIRGALSCAP